MAGSLPALFWLLLCHACTSIAATPLGFMMTGLPHIARANVVINNASGVLEIFNPTTDLPIAQGAASDGGGTDFSLPALVWIIFTIVVGLPMAVAGIRGWRLTTGASIGLSAAVCVWAAVINTVSSVGISDTALTIIVLGFFCAGFALGAVELGRIAGITLLGITGGLALGVRIAIMKDGLLFSSTGAYAVNWLPAVLFGAMGGLAMLRWQRAAICASCSSVGTFLLLLAVDLIANKQAGVSRGLRYLFDRNTSHLADIITKGYKPPILTIISILVSIALIPILAYGQHRVFPQPFRRCPPIDDDELNLPPEIKHNVGPAGSRFSV